MVKNIYPILDIKSGAKLDENFIKRLFSLRPRYMQIRGKNCQPTEIIEVSKRVIKLKQNLSPNTKIIINDYPDVALRVNADGVHLGQSDIREKKTALTNLPDDFIIGLSTHSLEQLKEADKFKADRLKIKYVGFGPLFNSISKKSEGPELFEFSRQAADLSKLPIVFIGGITLKKIELLPKGENIFYAMISGLKDL